mmetsp:Transcript_44525/g.123822  ORF Transcript_44525/g.123822 Transcript_44525/m.123822 type:complete len:290 (-) Transcript_44525:703-1572(-)
MRTGAGSTIMRARNRCVPPVKTRRASGLTSKPSLKPLDTISECCLLWLGGRRCCPGQPIPVPAPHVLDHLLRVGLGRRKHLHDSEGQRRHQELYEADLRERAVDLLAVIQRLHWNAELLLLITLQEELLQHLIGPQAANAEGLHRVGYVRKVEQQFRKELARLWLTEAVGGLLCGKTVAVFDKKLARCVENLRVHLVQHLDLFDHCEVLRVVRVQDRIDANLPYLQVLLLRQRPEDTALRPANKLEELSAVHVLQRGLVVVPQCQVVGGLDEEVVVKADVGNVVAHGAH